MKTTKLIITGFILALTFSCSLEEVPIDSLGLGNFYVNDADLIMSANACYASLKNDAYYGTSFTQALFSSADYGQSTTGANTMQEFTRSQLNSEHTVLKRIWATIYDAIGRTNTTIYRAENSENVTDTIKKRVIGEAKFLRALHYFNLVRCFGEVPLRIKPIEGFHDINLPISTRKQIYDQIIEDLKYAEQFCWGRNQSILGVTNEVGRATSLAATVLLAKVYLHIASSARIANTDGYLDNGIAGVCDGYKEYTDYKEYYSNCVDACNRGIANPDFNMETDWDKLWDVTTNKNPREYVFSVQSSTNTGWGNRYPFLFLPKKSVLGGSASTNGSNMRLVQEFVALIPYDTADYRFKKGMLLEVVYRDGTKTDVWEWVNPKQPLKLSCRYVIKGELNNNGAPILAPTPLKGLYLRKFNDPGTTDETSSQCELPLLRSVDLYLMKGEALAEISEIHSDGFEAINIVRSRVGADPVDDLMLYPFLGSNNLEKFREFVIKERLMEFSGEGDRWLTLIRMGCLSAKAKLVTTGNTVVGFAGNANKSRPYAKDYYWPISQDEINSNALINTNSPGY